MGILPIVFAIFATQIVITLAQQEVIVDIEDSDKTQYHQANFNTSAYQFGYEVGPNGQFHHETRGPDGVTYGCYGYIDPNGMLRVTHYVADSHGYRVIEPNHAVKIFADAPTQYSNSINDDESQLGQQGQVVAWKDLYLPRGCGMYPGGLRPDGPPITTTTPAPSGLSVGAGISNAGISGTLTSSHNSTVHSGSSMLGGNIGTSGLHASMSHNSSGSIFGATFNHSSANSGSLDGQGIHGVHTGSNSLNSTHMTISGSTNLEGSIEGAHLSVGGMINQTGTLAIGSVNVSSTSGGSFGGQISPEHIGAELGGMLATNASISAPHLGTQQGSVTIGGGGSVDYGRPPQEPSTGYPFEPTQSPESQYTTGYPSYPPTASGVQPPSRPIDTGTPPSSGNNNQYPPNPNYQVAVSQYPYFFVPYPYPPPPNVPQAPCNCPQDQNRPTGYLGFIPILYVPNCNAAKSGLPTHINWPAPGPPEGVGRTLEELPIQRLVQGEDGSWTVQQEQPQPSPKPRQIRTRRLRNRRPAQQKLGGTPFSKRQSEQETQIEGA